MKIQYRLPPIPWLLLGLAVSCHAEQSLQPLIDATAAGAILSLAPGEYTAPATVGRPIVIDGGGKAILRGNGSGTVLTLRTSQAVVRGLVISGSGASNDRMDAGLLIEGNDNRIEDNAIEDVLFGIHVKQGNGNRISRNRVTGKDLPEGMRGDGLRLWNSRDNVIEGNRFTRVRDLTFANSPRNVMLGNVLRDARYAMHFIFSPEGRFENNDLAHASTGLVALYSPGLLVRGNRFAHVTGGGGACLTFKVSGAARVEGNALIHCAVGFQANAPLDDASPILVRGNRFAHGVIGIYFYGEKGGHRLIGNRFEHNLTQVAVSAFGAGGANVWKDNYWSDYQGFDRNDDGIGDTPHEVYLYADRIWMEEPMTTFFRNSPAFELLDFLERLAPFAAPARLLSDPRPRVR